MKLRDLAGPLLLAAIVIVGGYMLWTNRQQLEEIKDLKAKLGLDYTGLEYY